MWVPNFENFICTILFSPLQVLLNSGLPTNVLGSIWTLADIDKDGFLDMDEMAVVGCFYLSYFLKFFVFSASLDLRLQGYSCCFM